LLFGFIILQVNVSPLIIQSACYQGCRYQVSVILFCIMINITDSFRKLLSSVIIDTFYFIIYVVYRW